jgi:hypothetical protein
MWYKTMVDKEEFDFVIKGRICSVSSLVAADVLESLFDGTPTSMIRVDVGNLSCYYPVRNEK